MDLKYFEQALNDKRAELKDHLGKLQSEAVDAAGSAEVKDSADDQTFAQGVSEALEESTIVSDTLEQVEAALGRIKDGTFGTCLACGRPIEPARLKAIPWAEYCLEDQDRLDQERSVPQGTTL